MYNSLECVKTNSDIKEEAEGLVKP
jgi:hypothetical protein